jgi:hypothetical protein
MSNADWWTICIGLSVVISFLWAIIERLMRIEKKLDKMSENSKVPD